MNIKYDLRFMIYRTILFPILFGYLIGISGFINATICALMIVILQLALSFAFKDKNIPKQKKTNFKEFRNIIKKHKEFNKIIENKICSGLTYSEGALSYVITIYIIKVFQESISLGIFTSVFSVISALIGVLFVKVIKPKNYNILMSVTSGITIVLLCTMLLNCNFLTIVLYNLFQTISKGLMDLINEKNTANYSNIKELKQEYKVEYYFSLETALFIGRVIRVLPIVCLKLSIK